MIDYDYNKQWQSLLVKKHCSICFAAITSGVQIDLMKNITCLKKVINIANFEASRISHSRHMIALIVYFSSIDIT